MKYFVQYYEKNSNGELWEAIGSDSVFILDGRNNLPNMISDGFERYEKIKNCNKFDAFQIMKGDILHNTPISIVIYLN